MSDASSAPSAVPTQQQGRRYPTLSGQKPVLDFTPRDTIGDSTKAAIVSTFFGINVALFKGTMGPYKSVFGGLRANAKHIWIFGAVGTSYTFVEAVTANLRRKESPLNPFLGGAAAGGILGSLFKSVPKIFGGALAAGLLCGFADWSGGLTGLGRDNALKGGISEATPNSDIEPGQRQGFFEVVHRRPLSQTLEELGDLAKPLK